MWLCERCYDSKQYRPFSMNARILACCNCKHRKRCYLVIRKQ